MRASTSVMYSRLRREEKEDDTPKRSYISALAFLHVLPKHFTTAEAKAKGEEMGIRSRAVGYKLHTLLNKAYILRTGYGAFQKAGAKVRRQAA